MNILPWISFHVYYRLKSRPKFCASEPECLKSSVQVFEASSTCALVGFLFRAQWVTFLVFFFSFYEEVLGVLILLSFAP